MKDVNRNLIQQFVKNEKKILNLLFCILSLSVFGQKRLFSPFKLTDYENLKNEYINAAAENDSLLILVDNYYLVKNKLDSIPNLENNLKSIFVIQKNNYTYFYRPNHNELDISFNNDSKKIVYWFQGDTNSEFINNEKIRTWNIYFNKNGQLKQTSTNLLSNNDQIGISEEYNIIGAKLFYANWDRDFKLTKQQVIKLSQKYIAVSIKDYVKENDYGLSEAEINDAIKSYLILIPKTYKYIDENREPNWLVTFNDGSKIEMKISDKTGKLIDFKIIQMIE